MYFSTPVCRKTNVFHSLYKLSHFTFSSKITWLCSMLISLSVVFWKIASFNKKCPTTPPSTLHLSLHAWPSERSGTLGAGPNYFLTISYLTLFQSRGGRLCPSHEFVPTKRLVDPVSIMEGVRLCLLHKLLSYQDFRHSGPPALILVSTKEWRMKIAERAKGTIGWFFFFWRSILIFIQLQFHKKYIKHGVLQNYD